MHWQGVIVGADGRWFAPFCAVIPEVQHRSALSGRKTLTLFCFDTLLVNQSLCYPLTTSLQDVSRACPPENGMEILPA